MNKPLIPIALLSLCLLGAAASAQAQQCSDDSGGQGQGQGQSQGGCYGDDNSQGAGANGANPGGAAPGSGGTLPDKELDGLNCITAKTSELAQSLVKDVIGKMHDASTQVVNNGENATAQTLAQVCGQGQEGLDAGKQKLKCLVPSIDKMLSTIGRIKAGISARRGHEPTTNTDFNQAIMSVAAEDSMPESEQDSTPQQRRLLESDNRDYRTRASCQQSVNTQEDQAASQLEQVLNDLKTKTGDQGSVSKFKNTSRAVLKADSDGGDGGGGDPGIYSCLGQAGTYQGDTTMPQGDGAPTDPANSPKQKFQKDLQTVDASFTKAQNDVQTDIDKLQQIQSAIQQVRGKVPCNH